MHWYIAVMDYTPGEQHSIGVVFCSNLPTVRETYYAVFGGGQPDLSGLTVRLSLTVSTLVQGLHPYFENFRNGRPETDSSEAVAPFIVVL